VYGVTGPAGIWNGYGAVTIRTAGHVQAEAERHRL